MGKKVVIESWKDIYMYAFELGMSCSRLLR